ncbi:MAG: hypothetical protein D6816_09805 [Bacteroidetes bacterium]|nr:MAG: hypothetical protein D6816_09805 [Bacteroidota bacterium]
MVMHVMKAKAVDRCIASLALALISLVVPFSCIGSALAETTECHRKLESAKKYLGQRELELARAEYRAALISEDGTKTCRYKAFDKLETFCLYRRFDKSRAETMQCLERLYEDARAANMLDLRMAGPASELSNWYWSQHRYKEAEWWLKEAIRLEALHGFMSMVYQKKLALGGMYMSQERWNDALTMFSEIVAAYGGECALQERNICLQAQLQRSQALGKLGQYQQAFEISEQLIRHLENENGAAAADSASNEKLLVESYLVDALDLYSGLLEKRGDHAKAAKASQRADEVRQTWRQFYDERQLNE